MLQLPAQPATAAEADAQERVTYVGCHREDRPCSGRLLKRSALFHVLRVAGQEINILANA